jgi:hypothetical protein
LLAIADAAGGDWPQRARQTLAQSQEATDDQSRLGLLLTDVKAIFAAKGADRLSSSDLVNALVAIEGRPWAEYGKSRKPVSKNQLARALKPLGIAPELARVVGTPARAYLLDHFAEAFERYLPPEGASESLHRYKRDEMGTSEPFQTVTPDFDVTVAKCEKSNTGGLCNGVADEKGGIGDDATCGDVYSPVCEHCGTAERTSRPVETFQIDGVAHHLHPGCRDEWLASPDPNDWAFNLEDGKPHSG